MKINNLPGVLRRLGIVIVFSGIGIWEVINPIDWVGYIPSFLHQFLEPSLLVRLHGASLIIVAAALLFGVYRRLFAVVGTIIMLSVVLSLVFITASGGRVLDILLRDIAIFIFVASLAFDESTTKTSSSSPK